MGAGASVEQEKLEWLKQKRSEETKNETVDDVLKEICSLQSAMESIVSVQEGTPLTSIESGDALAAKGFLKSIIYAEKCGIQLKFTDKAIDAAAGGGSLQTVEWLHSNQKGGATAAAITNAARNGHLDVVEWLHKNRHEGANSEALTFACRFGHLETAEWLNANRQDGCATFTLKMAAMNGHLQVVEWLFKNKDGPNFEKMKVGRGSIVASDNGHSAVAEFLAKVEVGGGGAAAAAGPRLPTKGAPPPAAAGGKGGQGGGAVLEVPAAGEGPANGEQEEAPTPVAGNSPGRQSFEAS